MKAAQNLEDLPSIAVARTIYFYFAVLMLIVFVLDIFTEKDSDGEFTHKKWSYSGFVGAMIFYCIFLYLISLPVLYFYDKLRSWLVTLQNASVFALFRFRSQDYQTLLCIHYRGAYSLLGDIYLCERTGLFLLHRNQVHLPLPFFLIQPSVLY